MKKYFVLFLFLIYSSISIADELCFKFYDLKGYSSTANEGEELIEDGFSNKEFTFIFKNGRVIPDKLTNGLEYEYVFPATFIGVEKDGMSQNIESWVIDLNTNRVYFNRVRTGFSVLNGNSAFIGKVKNCL